MTVIPAKHIRQFERDVVTAAGGNPDKALSGSVRNATTPQTAHHHPGSPVQGKRNLSKPPAPAPY